MSVLIRIQYILREVFSAIGHFFGRVWRGFAFLVNRFAFPLFFALFGLILVLVVIGNRMRTPTPEKESAEVPVKEVSVYHIDETAQVRLQAQVEKSGVVQIVAQSPGVIQKIHFQEGAHVKRGSRLFSSSTNYVGGNISSLARQASQKRYQAEVDNFDLRKRDIEIKREKVNKGSVVAAEMRKIGRESIDITKQQITLTEDVLRYLDEQLRILEDNNVDGSLDQQIIELKSQKAGTLASLSGLRTGLRTTEYNNDENKEPAQIERLSREEALIGLELAERGLVLSRDLALLTLKIDRVTESLMFPASPVPGTVERVYVNVGQVVAPGTLLATIRGDVNEATVVAYVSQEMSRRISRTEPTTIFYNNNQRVQVRPEYISVEPVQGTLHAVLFSIPDGLAGNFANQSTVQIEVPIGIIQVNTTDPYVPIDAVYQSQDSAYLYVVGKNDKGEEVAQTRQLTIGNVYGQYLEVEGISHDDVVILDRNVLEGDRVKVKEG